MKLVPVKQLPAAAANRIQSQAVQFRRVEIAVHAIGFLGVAALFVLGVKALIAANPDACTSHDQMTSTPGYILAAFTAGGFVAGRLIGWFRFHVRIGIKNLGRQAAAPPRWLYVVLSLALLTFLLVSALLLGYETWALANNGVPPPITSYVRCAAFHQQVLATATATGIGFIVSNWIWFP